MPQAFGLGSPNSAKALKGARRAIANTPYLKVFLMIVTPRMRRF
jgi:hypothetical protein